MTDVGTSAVLWTLGPVFGLLLLGGIAGRATPLLRRWGMPAGHAATWGMRTALTTATAGAAAVAVMAVGKLVSCQGAASCVRSGRVLAVPPPAPGLPALDLTVRVDGLAALFLLVVAFCGGCIAVFSFGWLHDDELRSSVASSFCLFLFATILTVVVNNAFWLLVALELMTLGSADLVRYKGRHGGSAATSRNAVRTYLVVSHVGLMAFLVGLLPIVVNYSTLDMNVLRSAGGSPVPALSFAFLLLGLCVRAGVTPFHFWVPVVHPELPTSTHAMMSAVMLKIPVYLMVRFFLEGIVGPVQWWWGAIVVVLGGVTALVTVFYAILSTDLKVALAYHSVENIGIILAGLGLALLFSDDRFHHLPTVRGAAGIALLASLYHVVNHALFKSLLFLGTGSIERHVGTVDLRRLGGLIRTLPWTAFAFLVGAMAIADLPPLNGFVSMWLTLQAMFAGQAAFTTQTPVALFMMAALAIAIVTLAMAFAATALAFVKIAGESLLGVARSELTPTREPWSMRGVLVVLAGTCVLLGLQPWLLVPWLWTAVAPLNYDTAGLTATPAQLAVRMSDPAAHPYGASLPTLPLLALVAMPIVLTVLLRAWRWARRPVWVGGARFAPRTMQYTGNALSALLWEPLSRRAAVGPANPTSGVPVDGDALPNATDPGPLGELGPESSAPFPATLRLSPRRTVLELANHLYNRLVHAVLAVSNWFGTRLQNGDVRSYLVYIFATVVLVLVVLAVIR